MSAIDNTLAAQIPVFDPATPLAKMAQIQAANQEIQQAQFKQNQLELGSEMRGLQPFVNSPDFPAKWREAADRLKARGVINDQMYGQWANAPSPLLMKSIISQTDSPQLAFQKEEAVRSQGNSNREYGLSQRRLKIAETAANETESDAVDERIAAAAKIGIKPGTPEYTAYLAGSGYTPATTSQNKIDEDIAARERNLIKRGQDPNTPQNQQFIMTGKYPREDAQPLSAADKKAIFEAEDDNVTLRTQLDTLKRAKELNEKTFTGTGAGFLGKVGSSVPGAGYVLDKGTSDATREFGQLMQGEAISAMSKTLKGATTDTEMHRFIEMLSDPTTPPQIRGRIIDRLSSQAQRQFDINESRMNDLRGGTYYKPKSAQEKDVMLRQAREAIAQGAPRDAVIQRLKDAKIDPKELDGR